MAFHSAICHKCPLLKRSYPQFGACSIPAAPLLLPCTSINVNKNVQQRTSHELKKPLPLDVQSKASKSYPLVSSSPDMEQMVHPPNHPERSYECQRYP